MMTTTSVTYIKIARGDRIARDDDPHVARGHPACMGSERRDLVCRSVAETFDESVRGAAKTLVSEYLERGRVGEEMRKEFADMSGRSFDTDAIKRREGFIRTRRCRVEGPIRCDRCNQIVVVV